MRPIIPDSLLYIDKPNNQPITMTKQIITLITLLALALGAGAAKQVQTQPQHPWQGKRVAYLGDSVTDPRQGGGKIKKYWAWLQEWLGAQPYVYAVSGRQWDDIPRQADKLKAEHGDDFDAIIIFMGTNDFNNGVAIGQYYKESFGKVKAAHGDSIRLKPRRHRELIMGKDTYCGRINTAMAKLKAMWPTKQIVVLTPIHRAGFFANAKNHQPAEDWANDYGLYIDDYVDATVRAGRVWAVPVIDMNAVSGLYPMEDNFGQYFCNPDNDRLHPNDAGHKRMARTLYYQLMALPGE